ncbi:MAG: alpha/beta fold hydrolase BchO [Pseudomonadota bacterium]
MIFSDLRRPDWSREGLNWPGRAHSQFVEAGSFRWHVQTMGQGETILLVHGTGAATHSWFEVAQLLSEGFRVVIIDLPGHGFTSAIDRAPISLTGVAGYLSVLLKAMHISPEVVVGHSSGVAILLQMLIDRQINPRIVISLNGAVRSFPGAAGVLFPVMAKSLYYNPVAAVFFAESARDSRRVRRLLTNTGSKPSQHYIHYYQQLLQCPGHVRGALAMMAHWRLALVERALSEIETPVLYIAAGNDKAVPPKDAHWLAAETRLAKVLILPVLGHLAQEEAPSRVAAIIEDYGKEIAKI